LRHAVELPRQRLRGVDNAQPAAVVKPLSAVSSVPLPPGVP
jgi:hypothetical protein